MRISDWSSDVCSSDLVQARYHFGQQPVGALVRAAGAGRELGVPALDLDRQPAQDAADHLVVAQDDAAQQAVAFAREVDPELPADLVEGDRKSTRLNSSH